jgi:hypothetical protein
MIEVRFKIFNDEGCPVASGTNYDIFTQGKTWGELMKNILDSIECHFDEPLRGQVKVTTEYHANLGAEATGS